MFPRVIGVRHLKDYQLEIRFSDGTVAELDFCPRIVGRGGVFGPLESVEFFKQEAAKHNTQYQRMIRRLLDAYAEHHVRSPATRSAGRPPSVARPRGSRRSA